MRKVFALVSFIAIMVAACERPTKDLLNVPVINEVDAVPAILAAQTRVREKGNAKIQSIIRFQRDGQPFTIHGQGTADFKNKRTVITYDIGESLTGSEGGPTAFAMLVTPKTLYLGVVKGKIVRGDETPEEWSSIDRSIGFSTLGQLSGGTAGVNPADAFLPLRGVQPGADFVGSEPIEDVQTSEFYVTIDPNEAVRRAVGDEKNTVRQQLFNTGDLLKVAVWLDATGLTHRYRLTIGQGQAQVTITTTMWDHGVAGSVALPPASKVEKITNPAELQKLFGSGGSPQASESPTPSPSGSPAASPSGSPAASPSATPAA